MASYGRQGLILVTVIGWLGFVCADERPRVLQTGADVDASITRLQDRGTRVEALDELIRFVDSRFNPNLPDATVDANPDRLARRASRAVAKYRNFENAQLAAAGSRERVQQWGISIIPQEDPPAARWEVFLPRLRELAKKGSAAVRQAALSHLLWFRGQRDFIRDCIAAEISPSIIMRFEYGSNGKGYNERMLPHLLRLLGHKGFDVRYETLLFIGFNSRRAPMWRIAVNDTVFERVLELSRSSITKERSAAVYALTDLRGHDPAALRQRMFELVDDTDQDVRWRIPGTLTDQRDRPDVHKLLNRLLRDKSAIVRYFTIKELGAEKHVRELRAIASGPDKRAAKFAAAKLIQIGQTDSQ